jgi:hypothetical protein
VSGLRTLRREPPAGMVVLRLDALQLLALEREVLDPARDFIITLGTNNLPSAPGATNGRSRRRGADEEGKNDEVGEEGARDSERRVSDCEYLE